MFVAVQWRLTGFRRRRRVEPEGTLLHKGPVKKLVVKSGSWNDRRWNDRWLELHKGELRYFLYEGGKLIDRILAEQVSEVKLIITEISQVEGNKESSAQQNGATEIFDCAQTEPNKKALEPNGSAHGSEKIQTLWDFVTSLTGDTNDLHLCFLVATKADHNHRGREYIFKVPSVPAAEEWVEKINQMLLDAIPPPVTKLSWTRSRIRMAYKTPYFQIIVALMIFISFMSFVYETQVNPDPGSDADVALQQIDIVLSIGFAVELAINLFCHDFLTEFVISIWNWFDFVVVVTSLVAIPLNDVPGLNELRLIRVMRVFRLFKSIPSLNKIVIALRESVPAVGNALGLVVLMCSIYAILGVTFFRDTDPQDFGDFATAMFTLYQFLTFDNSASITLGLMQLESSDGGQVGAALFMISFQIFMAYTLMNIGMAVLLEEFGDSSQRSRDEEQSKRLERMREKTRQPLDPIMAHLLTLDSEEALSAEILDLFHFIDEDGSGSIDFVEMRNGFMRMELSPPVLFEQHHFDTMVVREGLHDGGNMSEGHFDALMRTQLREYELNLMNKSVVEGRMQDKVNTILRSLKEVVSATHAIQGLEDKIIDVDRRLAAIEASSSSVRGGGGGGGGGAGVTSSMMPRKGLGVDSLLRSSRRASGGSLRPGGASVP